MDKNDVAKKLAKVLRQEARHTRLATMHLAKLAEVQAERCALLQGAAPEAGLEPDVLAAVVAPKDDDDDGGEG